MNAPVFVVGCPRSGTTLVQSLLDAHPRLALPPESHIFNNFSTALPLYGDLRRPANLRRLAKDLASDYRIGSWGMRFTAEALCEDLPEPSFRALVMRLFAWYARQRNKPRWGDKTPQHALFLAQIRETFPDARVLFVVRDGRDVAVSLQSTPFYPKRVDHMAMKWRQYAEVLEDAQRMWGEQLMVLRYEALVQDPTSQLPRMWAHVREEPIAPPARMADTTAAQYYLRRGAHFDRLAGPITAGRVGRFQQRLSAREVAIFETVAGPWLERLGYQPITDGGARLTAGERAQWAVTDHAVRAWRKLTWPRFWREELQRRSRHVRRRWAARVEASS